MYNPVEIIEIIFSLFLSSEGSPTAPASASNPVENGGDSQSVPHDHDDHRLDLAVKVIYVLIVLVLLLLIIIFFAAIIKVLKCVK